MAQSGPCVGPDVPQNTYVIKEELKTFAIEVFRRLDELKSSIPVPVPEPSVNPIVEALKAPSEDVKNLRASTATKDELKSALEAIENQTSAINTMKAYVVTEAGKLVTDVAIAGYCHTTKLKEEIKEVVTRALMIFRTSSSSAKGEVSALVTNRFYGS